MKLLLIDPVTTARTLSVGKRKRLRRGIGYPGIGLITVAALTPEHIEVKVIDESVEEIDFSYHPDLVGISVQAPTAPYAYRLSGQFRKMGIPVVLGGIHASLNPEESVQKCDALVIGEAEETWPKLIDDFKRGSMKKVYRAGSLADLNRSPRPARGLLSMSDYRIPHVVQASKGCRWGCEFCSLDTYVGYPPRFRRVKDVIDEIRDIPGDVILFADDNLYCDREYAHALIEAMIGLNKKWIAESTWHIAFDKVLLKKARKSGCAGLFIGFDSINRQPSMKKVPAGSDPEEIYINAIRYIRNEGIAVVAAYVFGLDNDDVTVFERSLRVVIEGGADLVNFSALVPYPGTPIFSRLKAENRIMEWDWSKYISPNVCFVPKHMSPEQLKEGVLWAQKKFYSLRNIMKTSVNAAIRLGWAMGLLSLNLNLAQRRNWGKGAVTDGR